jgi:hypothetical protein
MCRLITRPVLIAVFLAAASSLFAQQAPETFRWVDFHSPKDQDVVAWVTKSLAVGDWTAIREIAVEYDAALVVTANRATPQSAPTADSFTIWSASLTDHTYAPLIRGVNLRWLEWMRFADDAPYELAILYDDCRDCVANTYFTAFHYSVKTHSFQARWIRNGQGVPMYSANTPPGVEWKQAYAAFAEGNGREYIVTWSHFDYANKKPSDDYLYLYDLAPNGLDRWGPLISQAAKDMKMRICHGQDAIAGLYRGQDSSVCQKILPPAERKPVITPPSNNRGKMGLPGAKH